MSRRKKELETSKGRAAVNVPAETNRLINRGSEMHKVSKAELLANLMRFFSDAPDSVQLVMMGTAPRDLKEHVAARAKEYFVEMADRAKREHFGRWLAKVQRISGRDDAAFASQLGLTIERLRQIREVAESPAGEAERKGMLEGIPYESWDDLESAARQDKTPDPVRLLMSLGREAKTNREASGFISDADAATGGVPAVGRQRTRR
jgi:hypothetical protein